MAYQFAIALHDCRKIVVHICNNCLSQEILDGFELLFGTKLNRVTNCIDLKANICFIPGFFRIPDSYFPFSSYKSLYSRKNKQFLIVCVNCLNRKPQECLSFFRRPVASALLSGVLRGHKIVVVHGALLELSDGRGVLLSAESNAGKSTTCRRWEASGGKYTSDDMILLEYDTPDGIIAHPLPTWSRCQQSLEGLCYPIERCIPLAGVLVLSRAKHDEPEEIRSIPYPEFLCQVYQSCMFFLLPKLISFPEAEQRQLIANNQSCARKLCSLFPPRALMARLDGDLRETLKEFLC